MRAKNCGSCNYRRFMLNQKKTDIDFLLRACLLGHPEAYITVGDHIDMLTPQ